MNDAGRASRASVALALSVVGIALLTACPARADLISDVDRLVSTWRGDGADAVRLPPRFLEEGQLWILPIRHGKETQGCTTLVLLGARGTAFDVMARRSLDGLGLPEKEPTPRASDAGLAMVSRCGGQRKAWAHAVIQMSSRRGAIEAVVLRTAEPPRSPREVLPERAPVDRTPMGHPGRPPAAPPIADRLERAARRARAEGAEQVVSIPMRASAAGTGEFEVQLGEGCHRLELMAANPDGGLGIDLDAELQIAGDERVLARDRGDAADARMETCLGEKTSLRVSYVGAAVEADITLTTSTWKIPAWVPSTWGPTARAGFATALRRRSVPTPTTSPLLRGLGAQGWTRWPMTVEAGACYLAAVAMVRGDNTGLRLQASVDARTSFEALPGPAAGIVVTFCSEHSERAILEIETRGQAPRWALAVWPVGATPP